MRRKVLVAALLLAVAFAPPSAGAQARHAQHAQHAQRAQRTQQRESWFGADKIKHFFMSAFIESLTFSGLQAAGAHRSAAFAGAIGATAAFGIGKELHDRRTEGLFSIRDLTWDAAGAGAALVMLKSTQH